MNKLEANLSLLIITLFAAVQYVFLANVPASLSTFAFLSVTNFIGLVFTFVFFFRELFRLDRRQLLHSALMATELFGFNIFLLLGSQGLPASVSSCIVAAYFVFVPVFMILFQQKVTKNNMAGAVVVLAGVLMVLEMDFSRMFNIHVIYLLIADICFAMYLMTVDRFSAKANPSILAMGQMFFVFLLSLAAWILQSAMTGSRLSLPSSPGFWSGAVFIGFFIRGFYSVVQIYAQRYASVLNTALIFSTEIVMTTFLSPVLALLLGTVPDPITAMKMAGCTLVVSGVLIADGSAAAALKRRKIK